MKRAAARSGLPLLARELIDLANRRWTYVLRVVYAVLLFTMTCLILYNVLRQSGANPFNVLGEGREIFRTVVWLQFAGIYLFLPALMCGAIAHERQRDSLALLLATDLRPWEILIQKFAGRLVPMISFLLLSMPLLLAIAYAFGGVTTDSLFSTTLLLAATCLQVGAFCMMVSAWCRTTTSAFIASYLLGAALYLGLAIADGIRGDLAIKLMSHGTTVGWPSAAVWKSLTEDGGMVRPDLWLMFLPPAAFDQASMFNDLAAGGILGISAVSMSLVTCV